MKMLLRTLLLAALLPLLLPAASVVLTWQDNANNEDGFRLQRSANQGVSWLQVGTPPPNAVTFTDTTVAGGVTYQYRILAFNTAGASAWSNTATVAVPADPTAPVAPADLGAVALRPGRLVNVSARPFVEVGENIVIGGFVIEGDLPLAVLLRGVGPSLAPFGVQRPLADPQLVLLRDGGELARNDNWSNTTLLLDGPERPPVTLTQAAQRVFAFPLPAGSRDAALLLFLDPGIYTVHLSGVDGATGVALFEAYAVPPNLEPLNP